MSVFERNLTLWVALCILAGIGSGQVFPAPFQLIGGLQIANVNLTVAVLIWQTVIPTLLKIDFGALSKVREHWRGMGVTLFINWRSSPFRWRRSAGCSAPGCRPIRSTAISPD